MLLTFLLTEVCKCSPILVNHRALSELATHLQQGSLLVAHSQLPESQVRTTGRAIASHALKPTFRHREEVCFLASELFHDMYHNTLICIKYVRLTLVSNLLSVCFMCTHSTVHHPEDSFILICIFFSGINGQKSVRHVKSTYVPKFLAMP